MLLEEQTVLETAIDHYGRRLQTVKACEELTELIAALSRLTCLIETGAPEEEIHAEWDHVLEELADAEIMLQQMRMIYDGGQVDGIRARKLRRLAGRNIRRPQSRLWTLRNTRRTGARRSVTTKRLIRTDTCAVRSNRKARDPWCERCAYRTGIPGRAAPCAREGREIRLCLVRILLAELDAWTREHRRINK